MRAQALLPTDIEVWEPLPWPKPSWAIPNNSVVCTRKVFGIPALGGGEPDGDAISIAASPWLIQHLDATGPHMKSVLKHVELAKEHSR